MSEGTLRVIDGRTGLSYDIPIVRNAVEATSFRQIKAPLNQSNFVDEVSGGIRVVDEGLQNTAVRRSAITYLDSTNGRLLYRGHDIVDLIEEKKFEDISFLLIWSRLPSQSQKSQLRKQLTTAMMSRSPHVQTAIRGYPPNAAPVAMIIAGLAATLGSDSSAIPGFAGKDLYWRNPSVIDRSVIRGLSAMAVVVALVHCHRNNRPFTEPDPEGSFVSNFLLMMGFVDKHTGTPSPRNIAYLEKLFVLHADHEMSNATAALLHAASTRADPISCLIGAVAAVYGPIHGGAIDIAYQQLVEVGSPENVPRLIEEIKAKKKVLYGYGHRIYKDHDPRAKLLRKILLEIRGDSTDPIQQVALEIDRIASTDEFFTSRMLRANADLYACLVYTTLGFPQDIVFALILMARTQGYMAHWREFMLDAPRIWRPKQVYVGEPVEPRSKL